MSDASLEAHRFSINFISRRTLILGTLATAISGTAIGRAIGAVAPSFNQIIGSPTNDGIILQLLPNQKLNLYVEFGYSKTVFPIKSAKSDVESGVPANIAMSGLKPNSRIYYRIRSKSGNSNTYQISKVFSFMTQRASNSTFSFTVQGDTHPERAGKMFNAELYGVTLSNIKSQAPDFHILLGDDFSIDPLIGKGQANQANVEKVYTTHRSWLTAVGSDIPIFLVNGNHEQAAAYLLDGTDTNPAVLAGNARNKFFPLPLPKANGFYTGDLREIEHVGNPRDYYAWEWGDALFVTLDPYWNSKNPVDNVAGDSAVDDQGGTQKNSNKKNASPAAGGGNGKTSNLWTIGLGDQQYFWFKETLEKSKAKFKFVFAHHVMGTGRGAIEVSENYEWGGKDPKGQTTFQKERPNWELPIHDLMVKNGVSIFFQGHDHIFVTQERDGLIYQSMPNPADDTFSYFNDAAYKSGTKAPNSGHVRVTVSPASAKVEYFLAARPKDSSRKNLQIAHSYTVKAR